MNKKLDIFEAVEAIKNGKTVKSNKGYIYKKVDNRICFKTSMGNFIPMSINTDETEFEIIEEEKEVKLEEALKAYENGKDIKCKFNSSSTIFYNDYNSCYYYNIIEDDSGNGISLEEMLYGKWYIL